VPRAVLERSLGLYSFYVPLSRLYFIAPVFFLYFSERFSIDRVLQLEAIYYAAVVTLELPSGYLSDRLSRTAVLRTSALAAVVATVLFLSGGDSFALFAAAQVAIATSFSFASGTDTAYHYDTLSGLGRGGEYAEREARLVRNGLLATAIAALGGGLAGSLDLRFAYALWFVAGVVTLAVTLGFGEPPRAIPASESQGPVEQLGACFAQLRRPVLAWLFVYVLLQVSLEHVPYEFIQPYVALVLGEDAGTAQNTPLVVGVMAAVVAVLGSIAAAGSLHLRRVLGVAGALLAVTALQAALIGLMGAVVHAAVIPLLLLRSVHPAVSNVLVRAEITPRIPQQLRATYLSLHSLGGRLGFSGVLLVLSLLAGEGEPAGRETLSMLLRGCALLAVVGLGAMTLTRGALRRDPVAGA
jgi:predicted MFS family arabinose efflux permease